VARSPPTVQHGSPGVHEMGIFPLVSIASGSALCNDVVLKLQLLHPAARVVRTYVRIAMLGFG